MTVEGLCHVFTYVYRYFVWLESDETTLWKSKFMGNDILHR